MLKLPSNLSHDDLISYAVKNCVPKLTTQLHKGQCGRICVVGGSQKYTGSPFFSANAAALMGVNIVHLMCESKAAIPIKSYSPNLIVHPYLRDSHSTSRDITVPIDSIHSLIDSVDALVIGPGLGRDYSIFNTIIDIFCYIVNRHGGTIPVVIDADALFLISDQNYKKKMTDLLLKFKPGKVVLTPNAMELRLLYKSFDLHTATSLAQNLNCTVLEKGIADVITGSRDGVFFTNSSFGSLSRTGGQGDTLSGCVGGLLAFTTCIYQRHSCEPIGSFSTDLSTTDWPTLTLLSCYLASTITRSAAHKAFKAFGRGMQGSNLNECICTVFCDIIASIETRQ